MVPSRGPRGAHREHDVRLPDDRIRHLLAETLTYARERDYTGWDYGDGMSSRLLDLVPVENTYVNLAVQETVKRFPLNLRPLFRVEQRRNMKGTALFAMANGDAAGVTADDIYDREQRALADWLVANRVRGYSGFCLCHPHDLQTLDGRVPAGTPGVVGTSYGVRALLRAADRFDHAPYADLARTGATFLREDLDFRRTDAGAVIDYKPSDGGEYVTINAVALGARLLLDLHDRFGDAAYRIAATDLLAYVADRQTDRGGWYYRDPPSASHLSMDNHHNGFVVESFQRYDEVVDDRFDATRRRALAFYRDELFEPDGAPNFDEARAYPRDVHAAAQGVLVFTYAGDLELARRIVQWTVDELYLGGGRFMFRYHRHYPKRYVLMRWCQAWMAYALGEYLRYRTAGGAAQEQLP